MQKNKNINMTMEELIETFIEIAVEEKITATEIHEMVKKAWQQKKYMEEEREQLEKENNEEIQFREKAKCFLEKHHNNVYIRDIRNKEIEYEEDGVKKITTPMLEVLCAMHKTFVNKTHNSTEKLAEMVKNRLKAMAPNGYPAYTEAHYATWKMTEWAKDVIEEMWENGLKEFVDQYAYNKKSISHYILVMEWYISKDQS